MLDTPPPPSAWSRAWWPCCWCSVPTGWPTCSARQGCTSDDDDRRPRPRHPRPERHPGPDRYRWGRPADTLDRPDPSSPASGRTGAAHPGGQGHRAAGDLCGGDHPVHRHRLDQHRQRPARHRLGRVRAVARHDRPRRLQVDPGRRGGDPRLADQRRGDRGRHLRQPGRLDPAGLRAQSTRIVRSRADADDRPADPAVRARAHPELPGGQGAWSTGLAVVADRADGDQRVQRDRAAGVHGHPARADRQRPDRRRRRPQRVPADRAAVVEGGARGDWAVLRRRVLERVLQRPALPDVGHHPAPTSLGRQEVDGQHVRTIAALISPGGGRPRRDQGPRAAFVRVAARRPPNRPVRGTVHRSWPATPHRPRSAFAASSPVVAARSINATG